MAFDANVSPPGQWEERNFPVQELEVLRCSRCPIRRTSRAGRQQGVGPGTARITPGVPRQRHPVDRVQRRRCPGRGTAPSPGAVVAGRVVDPPLVPAHVDRGAGDGNAQERVVSGVVDPGRPDVGPRARRSRTGPPRRTLTASRRSSGSRGRHRHPSSPRRSTSRRARTGRPACTMSNRTRRCTQTCRRRSTTTMSSVAADVPRSTSAIWSLATPATVTKLPTATSRLFGRVDVHCLDAGVGIGALSPWSGRTAGHSCGGR